MNFEFQNNSPVYLQMADILESAIVSGTFKPGDRLPSVRELALQSRTNPNTVSKALNELERKGLIETRRTSGKFVCLNDEALKKQRLEIAYGLCAGFLKEMSSLGFSREESLSLLARGEYVANADRKPE